MPGNSFTVKLQEGQTIRLDKFIADQGICSRSQIESRAVRVFTSRGEEIKLSRRIRNGETVHIHWSDPPPSDILPEELPLEILYEDTDCLVINKSQGTVVHPALGHHHGTLVQGILFRYTGFDKNFQGDMIRPGIVHRLDKDTSGIMIVAKTDTARNFLAQQFKLRLVDKTYIAITQGIPMRKNDTINRPIGRDPRNRKRFAVDVRHSKEAITRYQILSYTEKNALLKVHLLTGRTHQIRVHLQSMNTPVLGDSIYGRKCYNLPDVSLMLHSWSLAIILPSGQRHTFKTSIPERFHTVANKLHLHIPSL